MQLLMKDLDTRTYPMQPSKDKHLMHPNLLTQQFESSNYIQDYKPGGGKNS